MRSTDTSARSEWYTLAGRVLRALGLVLPAFLLLAGCSDTGKQARWADGTLAVVWRASAPALQLQTAGAGPIYFETTHRERLGVSAFQASSDGGTAWRSELAAPGWAATLLSLERRPGDGWPVAAILKPTARTGGTLVLWCASSGTAALEHLYAFLLRSAPESRFELKDSCRVLGDRLRATERPSGAELLQYVALARAERRRETLSGERLWRVTALHPHLNGDEPLEVATLVNGADGPVPDSLVSFAREPHLACSATTDGNGMARCTLVDTHGHAPHDAGPVPQPTVVTFAGRVVAGFVDVPVVAVVETPRPTRCLSTAVPADVAEGWSASCRGFAPRTWAFPGPGTP